MGIVELLLVLSPVVADTLPPPPPPPPPPTECFDGIYRLTEIMPVAPGCETHISQKERQECTRDTLVAFVRNNLRWPDPLWCGEGMAVVSFTITKDGRLHGEKIVRSLGGAADGICRMILERLERDMPVWTPGMQAGRPVDIMYNLPIRFKLE